MAKIFTRMLRKRRKHLLRERSGDPLARLMRSLHWADARWENNGPSRADMVLDPCVYCGRPGPHSWDHIDPIARGGDGGYNLARACRLCNKSKYSTPLLQFLAERAWRKLRRKETDLNTLRHTLYHMPNETQKAGFSWPVV